MSGIKCIHGCGKSKKAGAAFCTSCGAALPGTVIKAHVPDTPTVVGPVLDPYSSDPAERELAQDLIYKAALGPTVTKGR
ncbi:hypothetical protein [Actinacidiphila rubida]|uniref:Zinc-ribbon domain-containing protein n=1 Tax=Actinacidiphila rubida TaxID=310780 RepID=A0A1H8L8S6_9ACTN|nr:hypothetical protein [Actinacidiphila rubida]SEO01584.1 hypothetical protein SAMN05216267_1015106 [Actinacidiphila rubida]